jgi:TPR repeat protein
MYHKAMEVAAGGDATVAVALIKSASELGHQQATACFADFQLMQYGGEHNNPRAVTSVMMQLWHEHNNSAAVLLLALDAERYRSAGADDIPDSATCSSALASLTADCEPWDMFALYVMAWCFVEGVGCASDPPRGFRSFQALAGRGYLPAMSWLGLCFLGGRGVDENATEAVKWYRRAAEQGHVLAQFFFGLCLEHGKGTAPDPAEAVKWYRLAAAQGQVNAQLFLGLCFEHGKGVEENTAEAGKWFRLAAAQGDDDAAAGLERLGFR